MTFYILHFTFYIFFAIFAWRRLPWAVLLTIVALPSYLIRFNIGWLPMTMLEGMILIIFAIWIVQKLLRAKSLELRELSTPCPMPYALCWPLMLFLIAATAAMFVAPDLRAAAGIWKAYFIEPILFFLVLRDFLHIKKLNITQIISAFSITALLLSVYAIYQRFTGFGIPPPWDVELRVTSIFPYPNALGLFLGPLAPLFVSMLFYNNKKLLDVICPPKPCLSGRQAWCRWVYWLIVIIVSILAIIFAKSTGALVGIAVGILFMSVFSLRVKTHDREFSPAGRYQVLWVKCYVIIISAFVVILLNVPNIRNELLLKDWSGHVRRTQWSETITMLKDRPILGAGLAGYKQTLALYHQATYLEIFEYPHNIVLNFWSEIGLLGLISFIWIIIFFFQQIRKQRPMVNSPMPNGRQELLIVGVGAAMLTLLVHGLVDVPYFKNDLAMLFWIIFALGLTNTEKFESIDQQNT